MRPSARARSSIASSASRSPTRSDRDLISLWLADGTNYPGQDDLTRAGTDACSTGWSRSTPRSRAGMRLLVEYKFFEPGFYSTDLPDWGTAALACRRLGPQAQVLVDTGHHPQGTNVEQIVALLLGEGLLGGFHFNNRKYADDDLIVGSIDPFELFRIMREIAHAADLGADRLHDRPVPQHRGKDRRDDPVGAQHPDRVRQGVARRRGRDWRQPSRRATCSAATGSSSRRSRPTCGRCSRRLRRELGVEDDPVEAFRAGGYAEALAGERGVSSVESAYEQL